MPNTTSYRTTAKGTDELDALPGILPPGLSAVLTAVGEKATAPELKAKFPRIADKDLGTALAQLARNGYIESIPAVTPLATAQAASKTAAPENAKPAPDDLVNFLSEKPKEPTVQQIRTAEGTLAGSRRLKAGYQINILNRPGKPVVPRGGGKHVILIIDSQEAEALVSARALLQSGFDVRGAGSKAEIVIALGKPPQPDLIIMDVELRDAVGLDVLGKLHEHPTFKDTPIVVVTARAERDDIVAALAYGACGYLNKPVKPDALVRYAKDALGLP